ncbi:MAG: hypothetical protein H6767_09620 [Candidatus Peribacteria bacterium]|nr:MAG: hypothetical protein H6767_09620 [Candidatus Peribacteria bacterium]
MTNSCVLNKKESSLYEGEENIVGTKTEIWNNVLYSFYDISCIDDYIALDDHSACKKEFINTNILLAGTSTKIGTMKQRLDTTNGSYINDSIVSCEAGYHLELNNCKINTKT